jgi:hypothetical protein
MDQHTIQTMKTSVVQRTLSVANAGKSSGASHSPLSASPSPPTGGVWWVSRPHSMYSTASLQLAKRPCKRESQLCWPSWVLRLLVRSRRCRCARPGSSSTSVGKTQPTITHQNSSTATVWVYGSAGRAGREVGLRAGQEADPGTMFGQGCSCSHPRQATRSCRLGSISRCDLSASLPPAAPSRHSTGTRGPTHQQVDRLKKEC